MGTCGCVEAREHRGVDETGVRLDERELLRDEAIDLGGDLDRGVH
jgi:hypothetical protein